MNRYISRAVACVIALWLASASHAADMPGGRPPADVAPTWNWSGLYVGLNAAYGWGQSDWSSSATSGSTNAAGPLFGATFGFNFQSGAFVMGVEGDVNANWMRDTSTSGTGVCSAPGCEIQTSWFATTRSRLGYAMGPALLYVTAGGAFDDIQMLANGLTAKSNRAGWTAGAGIEYSFLGPWSAKLEYLYADFGSTTCGAATCGVDTNVNFTTNIFRFGVNYRF